MDEEIYITKEEALKNGYVHRKEGGYYKKSVLEKYYDGGYLHLPDSPFSDEDRKKAGEWLAKDYYLGHYNSVQAVNFDLKIRSTSESGRETALFYQNRYLQAMKSVPNEFLGAIRRVCIEDKELHGEETAPRKSLLNKQSVYHQKMLLSLGLERLIKFYLQKNKKSS